jgi:hypothetical protein
VKTAKNMELVKTALRKSIPEMFEQMASDDIDSNDVVNQIKSLVYVSHNDDEVLSFLMEQCNTEDQIMLLMSCLEDSVEEGLVQAADGTLMMAKMYLIPCLSYNRSDAAEYTDLMSKSPRLAGLLDNSDSFAMSGVFIETSTLMRMSLNDVLALNESFIAGFIAGDIEETNQLIHDHNAQSDVGEGKANTRIGYMLCLFLTSLSGNGFDGDHGEYKEQVDKCLDLWTDICKSDNDTDIQILGLNSFLASGRFAISTHLQGVVTLLQNHPDIKDLTYSIDQSYTGDYSTVSIFGRVSDNIQLLNTADIVAHVTDARNNEEILEDLKSEMLKMKCMPMIFGNLAMVM